MRIGRSLPPAAAPIYFRDIVNGLKGLIRGKKEIDRFNSELRHFFSIKHVFLVSSGKAALTMILKALHDLNPDRDDVLIPAFCCYSVPSAIVRAGLKVKLCDINSDTLDFDYTQLKSIFFDYQRNQSDKNKGSGEPNKTNNSTNKLLAIIPVHLFGIPADVNRVKKLVTESGVVVEDAAQVLGATWNDKQLGILGDVGFFSLGRGKALSTVEGGIILTNRDDISENLRNQLEEIPGYNILEMVKLIFNAVLLIVFQHPLFFWVPKSLSFLRVGDTFYDPEFKIRIMSGFQAGLTKNWEGKLEEFKNNRRENSKQLTSISGLNSIQRYCSKNDHVPDMLRFPVRVNKRGVWENILKESDKNGHGIMFTYPDSINGIDELRKVFKEQTCPVAEKLPQQLLTLPIHPYVLQKDIKNISKLLTKLEKSCLQ